jgi:DNA polymerase-4
MTHRRILHVDVDAMFVQCAARQWPDTAGRATLLIVGGSAEERGVVTSASYAARKFGVRAGMPSSTARRLCPQALFVPVPREMVGRMSREIFALIAARVPLLEQSGVDEGYADLSGTEHLPGYEDPGVFARALRQQIVDRTGMTCSFAVATNKLVSKCAVEYAKPGKGGDGVIVVPPGGEADFMRRLTLTEVPGIGPAFGERLARVRLRTVEDVLRLDLTELAVILGADTGRWLYDRVRGVSHSAVELPGPPKSLSREDTFPRDLHDDAVLERELARLVERVAQDLRDEGMACQTVTVSIKDGDFTRRSRRRTLAEPVRTAAAIHPVAVALLRELREKRRVPARLVGVTLEKLAMSDAAATVQLALFDAPGAGAASGQAVGDETQRDRDLAAALDAVRAKYGAEALRPGRAVKDR